MAEQYTPGSIFKKALDEPENYSIAKAADESFNTDLTSLYDNLKTSREKLNYLTARDSSTQAPSVSGQKPGIASDLLGGNALTGPEPSKRSADFSTLDYTNELIQKYQDIDQISQDPYKWAKPYSFNTGVNNADFDRYYTHPLYSKLGYSPFRDNEALYNEKASWSDDFSRMGKQWFGLAWEGVKSMWGSSDAEEFERRLKVSQTSKEGFGAFTTNLLGNFAYTAGVASDLIVEELLLSAITIGTGGTTAEVTLPTMALKFGRGIQSITGAFRSVTRMNEALQAMKAASSARNFYNANKLLKPIVQTADFLNPLKYSTRAIYGMATGAKGYNNLENLAKISTTSGAFLRDLVRIRAAYGESKLEGDNMQIRITDDLIGDYYRTNGVMPEGKHADRIYDLAREANVKSQLYNLPLLMITNDMVFGKAFRGFQPKWLQKAEIAAKIPVEVIENVNWKKGGVKAFEKAPEGFKKFLKPNYWKQTPSKIVLGGLNYGKANFFEGGQETMQEVISVGLEDYYKKIYSDPLLAGSQQYWASMKHGAASQLSGQGFETFMSGFLMGGILQVPQNLIMGYLPRFQKNYAEYKAYKDKQADTLVDAMNDVVMNTGKYASAIEENVIVQKNLSKDMQASENSNDRKTYQDAKNASMFTHMYTLLGNGQYDTFVDSLNDMKDLSDEELMQAFNIKTEGNIDGRSIRQRLESTVEEAESIKTRYNEFSKRFANPADPGRFNKQTQPDQWLDENLKSQAFEQTKFHATFGYYNFLKTLDRMKSVMEDTGGANRPLGDTDSTDITALFDTGQRRDRRKTIAEEVKVYQDGTPEQKRRASKLSKQLDRYDTLTESIDAYTENLEANRKPSTEPLTSEQESERDLQSAKILSNLKDAYFNYVKVLAVNNNTPMIDEKVYPSLNNLIDYLELSQDNRSLAQYINFLHNPDNFITTVNRQYQFQKQFMADREKIIREAISKFEDMGTQNTALNEIGNLGLFMSQDSVDAFLAGDDSKITFQHAAAPYGMVEPGSEKYIQAMKIIAEYRAKTTPPPVVTEVPVETKISTDEYNKFVQTGEIRQEILATIAEKIRTNQKLSVVEQAIRSDKHDEIEALLKKPEAKPVTEPPAAIKPTEVIPGKGEVIYATPTTGKSTLAAEMPGKYVDGDEILLNYLKDLAEDYREIRIPENAQGAGLAFFNFISGRPDRKTFEKEIRDIYRRTADEGKNVLTGNWFALDIADRTFLSKDKPSLMAGLRQRGQENVELEAQRILDREERYQETHQGKWSEIPAGLTLTDILEKKMPAKEEGKQALLNRISKAADLNVLSGLEESIAFKLQQDPEYLIRYDLDSQEIMDLINKRREEITKSPTFAALKKGTVLLMKDGRRIYVTGKNKQGTPRVKRQGEDKITLLAQDEMKRIDRIILPGEVAAASELTPADKAAAAENLKNQKEFLSDLDAMKRATDEAKDKTKDQADDDLTNTICT